MKFPILVSDDYELKVKVLMLKVDYDKLITEFGCSKIEPALIERYFNFISMNCIKVDAYETTTF